MYRIIVTGADGSESAAAAVRSAAELAATTGGVLHVVSIHDDRSDSDFGNVRWNDPDRDADEALAEAMRIGDGEGVRVVTHRAVGDPAAGIIRIATEVHADLIVVGNRGMRGSSRFALDSVPSRLAMHAGCNVLIVRTT